MAVLDWNELLNSVPVYDLTAVEEAYQEVLAAFEGKVVVLDDDPTGGQTVHHVSVYTDWSAERLEGRFCGVPPDVLYFDIFPQFVGGTDPAVPSGNCGTG